MKQTAAGYTLLELMVALAVIAAITGIGVAGLRLAQSAWERTSAASARTGDVALSARVFRRLVNHGVPGSLSGTDSTMRMTSIAPPYPTLGGPHRVTLRIERIDGVSRLLLDRLIDQINPASPYWGEDGGETVLLDTPARLTFAYLETTTEGVPVWQAHWESGGAPDLVALRADPEPGRPGGGFEIWARLDATLDVSCIQSAGAGETPRLSDTCR